MLPMAPQPLWVYIGLHLPQIRFSLSKVSMVNRVNPVFLVQKYSILSWHYVEGKRPDIRLHG